MINILSLIKAKFINAITDAIPDIFFETRGIVLNWIKPKIQNFPGILILFFASIGINSMICDSPIWVLLKEIPFIFNSIVCLSSAVSVLIVILLVKIIEITQRRYAN